MAGEQKGIAYEALTKLILEDLKVKGKLRGRVFWEKKPDGMTINPDLTVGRSYNAPDIIIMISHGGSAKESNRKYWRNCGELVEGKLQLTTVPKVFSLFFDAVIKADIKKVGGATFDGELIVGDRPYGADVLSWMDQNFKTFPKDRDEKVDCLRILRKTDKELMRLCRLLTKDMGLLLSKKAPKELSSVWAMERARKKGVAPTCKETFVRRGLSKLLIFEDLDVAIRLYSGKRVSQDEVPEYAYELGLATKFSHGKKGIAKPADDEIENAVRTLGATQVKQAIAKAPLDRMEGWLVTLRNSSHLTLMGKYVVDNYSNVCEPGKLEEALKKLYRNEKALVQGYALPENWPPKTVWLFDFLLEIIKLDAGNPTAYGLAQLEKDCSKVTGMPSVGDPVYRTKIPGWSHRRAGISMPSQVLKGISKVLSGHLNRIGESQVVKALSGSNVSKYLNNIIEAKLCTYRSFEPLRDLIMTACPTGERVGVRSCFGERAGLAGTASKTTLLQVKSTLVKWQSASNAGRDHKKKELCGRAVALRYSWDSKAKKFIPRPGVKKMVLVVDGTWRQSDLDALVRAGWDEIFYPDEMGKLAKAII